VEIEGRVKWWHRALLVAVSGVGVLIACWAIASVGSYFAMPLFLLGALVPLVPLLVRGRRDFTLCCVVTGSGVFVLALLMAGLGMVVYIPTALVMVLVGAAGRTPAAGVAALAVAVLALGGFGVLAVDALSS
jgi:hypothetical protein